MYIRRMRSTPRRPAIRPHTPKPSLSHPANQPFRALSGIVHPLPGWDRYEAASPQERAAIERQWKDNWPSEEAQRLYRRATARRTVEHRAIGKHTADCSAPSPTSGEFTRKLDFKEQTALHAADPAKYGRYLDWLFELNAPATRRWGLREFLHRRDLDRERETACGDDYEVTPEQFGWRSR